MDIDTMSRLMFAAGIASVILGACILVEGIGVP